MKVEIENGILVCGTDSEWKNLPENEHEFLHDCFGFWEGFTKEGKLRWYELHTSNSETLEWRMRHMLLYAKTYDVEVTDEVRALYAEIKERADEERRLKRQAEILESKRRKWEYRERTGCADCRLCERIGDGWFRCQHSGDELEVRFSEVWDPVSKSMIIFHEVGVPNVHCKDYYQERKEWR